MIYKTNAICSYDGYAYMWIGTPKGYYIHKGGQWNLIENLDGMPEFVKEKLGYQ